MRQIRQRRGDAVRRLEEHQRARLVRQPRQRARRSPARAGRKPSNANRSVGRPAMLSAAVSAEAPGIARTSMPAAAAARTSAKPGSDSSGVPASLTSAIDLAGQQLLQQRLDPRLLRCSRAARRSCARDADARRAIAPVRRVSSAAIRSAAASASRARGAQVAEIADRRGDHLEPARWTGADRSEPL